MKQTNILLTVLFLAWANINAQTTDVITGISTPVDLQFSGNELYFTELNTFKLSKTDITATPPVATDVVTLIGESYGLALNGNDLYIARRLGAMIQRIDITETAPPTLHNDVVGLDEPMGIAFNGNTLYIAEFNGNKISKIDVSTTPNTATEIVLNLNGPAYLAFHGDDLYISEFSGNKISKIDVTATTPIATDVVTGLNGPMGLAFVGNDLYVAEFGGNKISKIDVTATTLIATDVVTSLSGPFGLRLHSGALYIAEFNGNKISKFEFPLQIFELNSITPTINSIDVAQNDNIVLNFNQDVDPTTLTSTNLILRREDGSSITYPAPQVVGAQAIIDPQQDFLPGERISLNLSSGIQSTTGIPLLDPITYQFTTAVATSPGIFPPRQNSITTTADGVRTSTTGDIDGDGDQDVILASYNDNRIAWYANDGSGNFGAAQNITTIAFNATSVSTADLDGDGDLDVFSASENDNRIAWYANDGSGNFGAQQTISTAADGAQKVTSADLDGDGDLDVLSASYYDDRIAWYANDGAGNFGIQQNISTTADGARSVATADLDGDGDLDVLSASELDGRIAWYVNDGAGNFTNAPVIFAFDTSGAFDVTAADLDGDGNLDILCATDSNIAWFNNGGTGSFGFQQNITTSVVDARSVTTGDLDGDGDLDVISASFKTEGGLNWYVNDGIGSFERKLVALSAQQPWSVNSVDLDGDGDLDLLSASENDDHVAWHKNALPLLLSSSSPTSNSLNVAYDENIVLVFDRDVASASITTDNLVLTGDCGLPITYATPQVAGSQVTINPNRDFLPGEHITLTITLGVESAAEGIPLLSTYTHQFTAAVATDGSGDFILGQNTISTTADGAREVTSADLDGDGDLDVVSASYDDNRIAWYANNGTGGFGTPQTITSIANNTTGLSVADLDNDGDLDVLSASEDDERIAWYANDGTGNFGVQQTISTLEFDVQTITTADLDGDGDQDVITASRFDWAVAWYSNDGAGNFSNRQTITLHAGAPYDVITADLNGDGTLDVLVASEQFNQILWYANDGFGNFAGGQMVITTNTDAAKGVSVADLDGDGDLDVLSASENDDRIAWYANDGIGNFGGQQNITTLADGARNVTTADLDGDGDQDVLSASILDNRIAWYVNDGSGNFGTQQTITTAADGAYSVNTADLDGDGDLDVLSASFNDDRIAWYENKLLIPVITLNGPDPQIIELGDGYTELGATADDGSTVTIDASNFVDAVGSYTITYNATNSSGNSAVEVTRTVNVVDTTKPVITLNGTNPQTIELGDGYTELGAIADDGSTVIIDTSNFVDAVGSYTITYNATDASGNAADQVTRTVNVVDTTKPVITLNGTNPQTIELGDGYTELGATANDGSTVIIDTSNFVDAVGNYTITYNATDASGNAADQVTRTVNVVDTTKPTITLNGDDPQIISLGDGYTELGATANDGSTVIIDTSNFVDAVGSYTITYNAADASGNVADQVTRTVNVVDTTKPVITLNGDNPQIISLGDGYTELGATANDGSTVIIDASNFVDAVGSYTITYNATDASGNAADQVTRTVNVIGNDNDNDGIPDDVDTDDDNDGTPDDEDDFPTDPNEDTDTDGDGIGDNADPDDDGDGIPDSEDSFPIEVSPSLIPAEAFTPNGDGINDAWVVPGINNYPNNIVRVYNRWGHEVFAASNYQNNWTGRYKKNSSKLPSGSYLYVIDLGDGSAIQRGWIFINY